MRIFAAGDNAGKGAGFSRYNVSPTGTRGWSRSEPDPMGGSRALTDARGGNGSAFQAYTEVTPTVSATAVAAKLALCNFL